LTIEVFKTATKTAEIKTSSKSRVETRPRSFSGSAVGVVATFSLSEALEDHDSSGGGAKDPRLDLGP